MNWEDKGLLYLKIEDNGSGFSELHNLNKTDTLGFELVSALTKQINGDYEIKNEGKGLGFIFHIPLS